MAAGDTIQFCARSEMRLATVFDKNYATQGLALYRSLEWHSDDFTLHILACDSDTYWQFTAMKLDGKLPFAEVHHAGEFDPPLARAVRNKRWPTPYYFFTMTPLFTKWIFDKYGGPVSYIDADCMFFCRPNFDLGIIKADQAGVVPHRFPAHDYQRLIPNGKFNVSLVTFGRDSGDILNHWLDRVLVKCDAESVGDQKYLDEWESRFPGRVVSFYEGVGPGPWNIYTRPLSLVDGIPMIDGFPIIFYHYHEFRYRDGSFNLTGYPIREIDRELIYAPYIARFLEAKNELASYSR